MKNFQWRCFVVIVFLFSLARLADALNKDQKPTFEELIRLPVYCQIKMKYHDTPFSGPDLQSLQRIMGPDYIHIHHYCYGLNWMQNRILEAGSADDQIKFCYERAIGEFGYVIRNSTVRLPLLPEAYYNKAKVLEKLQRYSEALSSYGDAIRIKRNYVQAYLALSDILWRLDQRQEALSILRLGIKQCVPSAVLEARLHELEGAK